MEALAVQKMIDATPMGDRQRWWIKGIPAPLWLAEEARSGVNLKDARRAVLKTAVSGRNSIDLSEFYGLNWRTVAAILEAFSEEGLLQWRSATGGLACFEYVSPLARRALRGL